MTINSVRLLTSLALGAAIMLSASAFAQDKKVDVSAVKPGSKQPPVAAAASETTINLKVTGMT